MISLLPYITEFASDGLEIEGLQQKQLAESWHQTDDNRAVYQYSAQSSGWDILLIAIRQGNELLGFVTQSEYNILQNIKNTPQPLTIVHPDSVNGIRVMLDSLNLVKVLESRCQGETWYTGSLNFKTI